MEVLEFHEYVERIQMAALGKKMLSGDAIYLDSVCFCSDRSFSGTISDTLLFSVAITQPRSRPHCVVCKTL